MTPLHLVLIAIRDVRNLARVDLAPAPRWNVLSGPNGAGKTSVLEAVYLACTSASFRTSRLAEVVRRGESVASARVVVDEGGERREQVAGVEGNARRVVVDGKAPDRLAAFAVRTPVVVFHPGELALSAGPSSPRRRLLDRVALFEGPASGDDVRRYGLAARARQRVLATRGPGSPDVEPYEDLMARHGAAVCAARARAASDLAGPFARAFARISASPACAVAYRPAGPTDEDGLRRALRGGRARDARLGSAGAGPHRDDLDVRVGGEPARTTASQGQHRAVALALKIAEIECIRAARGVHPILLLDDVSSELDEERAAGLFGLLHGARGQVFLTTARRDLLALPAGEAGQRTEFVVRDGTVAAS